MSVAIVGTPATGEVDNAGTPGTTSYTVPKPTGLAQDELWVICTWFDPAGTPTGLSATGFTAAHASLIPTANFPCMRVLYKVAGASESNATVTISGAIGSYVCNYVSFRVTGFLTSPDPIDVVATDTSNADSSDTRAVPSVTVSENGSLAIVTAARADASDATDNTVPGSMTEMYEHETWTAGIVGYQAVNAGSFNPGNVTIPYNSGDGDWVMSTVIIAPAPEWTPQQDAPETLRVITAPRW